MFASKSVRVFVFSMLVVLSLTLSACGGGKLDDNGAFSCPAITECVKDAPLQYEASNLNATLNDINDAISK